MRMGRAVSAADQQICMCTLGSGALWGRAGFKGGRSCCYIQSVHTITRLSLYCFLSLGSAGSRLAGRGPRLHGHYPSVTPRSRDTGEDPRCACATVHVLLRAQGTECVHAASVMWCAANMYALTLWVSGLPCFGRLTLISAHTRVDGGGGRSLGASLRVVRAKRLSTHLHAEKRGEKPLDVVVKRHLRWHTAARRLHPCTCPSSACSSLYPTTCRQAQGLHHGTVCSPTQRERPPPGNAQSCPIFLARGPALGPVSCRFLKMQALGKPEATSGHGICRLLF